MATLRHIKQKCITIIRLSTVSQELYQPSTFKISSTTWYLYESPLYVVIYMVSLNLHIWLNGGFWLSFFVFWNGQIQYSLQYFCNALQKRHLLVLQHIKYLSYSISKAKKVNVTKSNLGFELVPHFGFMVLLSKAY